MGEKLEEAEFWLPSEFLTDEDILMDHLKPTPPPLRFPAAFPFEFGSSALSSPVESLMGSAETESSDEEDTVLAELTRQLTIHGGHKLIPLPSNREKSTAVSGSPQSTLTKVGSWSGRSTMSSNSSSNGPSQVSSPPTTPLGLENDPWDLIYQAAGHIARLKMSGADGPTRNPGPTRLPTPAPLRNTSPMMSQDACGMWSSETQNAWRFDSPEIFLPHVGMGNCPVPGRAPCVWPNQQRTQQLGDFGVRNGGFGYGFRYGTGVGGPAGGVKTSRAGTGVFLPRRYENTSNFNSKPVDFRKKPVCTPALHPNKAAISSDNGKPGYVQNGVVTGDYEATMARRNAALAQQRRNLSPDEIRLPQEWTY